MSDTLQTHLVTGAAGFIGCHLSLRLLEEGCAVLGFDNLNDYYDVTLKQARLKLLQAYPRFSFVQGDLADEAAVTALFAREEPAIVVNLAAQAGVRYSIENPHAYIQSNVVGFLNILEACRRYPVEHLVYASSSSVYGNQEKTPFSIDDRADAPVSLYAATKRSNELMAYTYSHLYGIPATGLRFFTVYGPYGRPDMAYYSFTRRILAGKPIQLYHQGDLRRDFTYIDDIVQGLMSVLSGPPKAEGERPSHRLYNIGNNRPENLLHFVEVLERCLGKRAQKEFLPMQPGDVYQTFADVDDLTRDFGFRPKTSMEEGLDAFVRWYKEYYGH